MSSGPPHVSAKCEVGPGPVGLGKGLGVTLAHSANNQPAGRVLWAKGFLCPMQYNTRASLGAQSVENLPVVQETQVRSLGWGDPLEKEMAAPPIFLPGVGCHFLLQCMKVKSESEVAQLCPTFHNPMDCSLPGSSMGGNPWDFPGKSTGVGCHCLLLTC